jgi:integrase
MDSRNAFVQALERAGIEDFKFHDLRHSAASYLAMAGASPSEIAAVLGHKTLAMVKRYSHISDAHTRSVVTGVMGKLFADE